MKIYNDLAEPSRDLNALLRESWGQLPEEVRTEVARWDGPGHNNQDRNAAILEAMWAQRTHPGIALPAAQEVMAGIALFYDRELGLLFFRDGRGEKMANALRRDMGEPGYVQPEQEDPDPLPQFAPAAAGSGGAPSSP
ncbi:MAG TPA: hypothetical protein VF605_11670 [Allosphingosinicella sp.]|jgi:hypothetical protein